jgi:hypothetical protein
VIRVEQDLPGTEGGRGERREGGKVEKLTKQCMYMCINEQHKKKNSRIFQNFYNEKQN